MRLRATHGARKGTKLMNEVSESGQFLEVSECLTGFSRVELLAAGMAGVYDAELRKVYGDEVVSRLLREVRAVIEEADGDEAKLEALMLARVFNDATVICAPAKNLAQMWYLGTLIDYTDPTPFVVFKRTTVVSAEAYQRSLVLTDVGSHPAGAKQPGFGSWALGPAPAPQSSQPAPTSKKERT
jgi:hypothetical protein